MFISIINDNFRHAREHLNDHQHIISFMLEKFQRWIGWKRTSKEEQDALMRTEYFHPIERFPDRIDQLLNAINQLYMGQKQDLSRMQQRPIFVL